MNAPGGFELAMERLIRAPRSKVFQAFTTAEVLRQWFGPRAMRISTAEVDARAGGHYRIVMTARTGESYALVGVYREVRPFERLSFTWRWDQPGMEQMGDTLVDLTFEEQDGATLLTLRHTGFPMGEARDQHRSGWGSTLNCLLDLVDERGSAATLTLFGDPRSTYTRTARMALAEKGLKYRMQPASPGSEVIASLHPFRKIPVLQDGDLTLFETSAILRYLEESFDGTALLPANGTLRAQMEQWVSAINCYVYPVFIRDYALAYLFPRGPEGKPDPAVIAAALPAMGEQLKILDAAYGSRDYLTGTACSMADLLLAPILHTIGALPEGSALLMQAPNVHRAHAVMTRRESFTSTIPT